MGDLRERFRGLDDATVSDVWRRVEARGPQPPMTFPTPPSRRVGAAVLTFVLIVVVTGLIVWRNPDPARPPTDITTPVPGPATGIGRITDRIPAGQFPDQVAVGFGSDWVGATTEEPGPVLRITRLGIGGP